MGFLEYEKKRTFLIKRSRETEYTVHSYEYSARGAENSLNECCDLFVQNLLNNNQKHFFAWRRKFHLLELKTTKTKPFSMK